MKTILSKVTREKLYKRDFKSERKTIETIDGIKLDDKDSLIDVLLLMLNDEYIY